MSTTPQGFMGINLDDVTKLLPPQVADAIKGTVGNILGDAPGTPNIGDPQPPGTPPIPVAAGSKELSGAVKAIDAAVSAIDLVLKFKFLIPDQFETPLSAVRGALTTIRGWLD